MGFRVKMDDKKIKVDIEKTNVLNTLDIIALFGDFYWTADDDLNGIYAWKFE